MTVRTCTRKTVMDTDIILSYLYGNSKTWGLSNRNQQLSELSAHGYCEQIFNGVKRPCLSFVSDHW